MPDPKNIQGDIDDLQERRRLASEKLHRVECQKILETRAEEKIRLEQVIQEVRADRAAIDQDIQRLALGLQGSQDKLGQPFGVPNLPPRYLERPEYLDLFREALLSGETEAVGITGRPQYIGVQGMGGLGKSVLAAALAWDEEVRRAFPDGIFWLRFGQEVDEAGVLELQKEILLVLAPDSQPESPAQGRNLLNLALQGKRCLLIADDLWESRHINYFDLADSGSRFLLTTRNNEVIQDTGAHRCELELLSDKQARELLTKYSGLAEEALPEEAEAILRECNRLPLTVAAIGSMVNGKGHNRWQLALDKLQNARLDKIPAKFDRYYGYENLFKVFQVSVEDLPPEVQTYFKTLLVFPEDTEIPESVLELYWDYIGQGEYDPPDAIDLLVQRSLLTPGANHKAFVLHDLLRDYLLFQGHSKIAELHRQLLEAYRATYPGGWYTIPHPTFLLSRIESDYFGCVWHYHATASGDHDLSYEIADNLIRHQPKLNMNLLQAALEFVDYDLKDIAPHLLKINKDKGVLERCLEILGKQAKEDALILLQKRLPVRQYEKLIIKCLEILGKDAENEAARLVKENVTKKVLLECLKVLGEDGKEHTWCFLKKTKSYFYIEKCLFLLGDDAKGYARSLLKDTESQWTKMVCINFLGKESKKSARLLLETAQHEVIRSKCKRLLVQWEKEALM